MVKYLLGSCIGKGSKGLGCSVQGVAKVHGQGWRTFAWTPVLISIQLLLFFHRTPASSQLKVWGPMRQGPPSKMLVLWTLFLQLSSLTMPISSVQGVSQVKQKHYGGSDWGPKTTQPPRDLSFQKPIREPVKYYFADFVRKRGTPLPPLYGLFPQIFSSKSAKNCGFLAQKHMILVQKN